MQIMRGFFALFMTLFASQLALANEPASLAFSKAKSLYLSPADNISKVSVSQNNHIKKNFAASIFSFEFTNGPYGGSVQDIVHFPTKPNMLFAATRGGGVYKSVDGGVSWIPSGDGITMSSWAKAYGFGIYPTHLIVVTRETHPAGHEIFVGTEWGQGIFKSTDEGNHWIASNNGITLKQYSRVTELISYSLDLRTTVLLATVTDSESQSSVVYQSTDFGKTWNKYNQGLPSDAYNSLCFPVKFINNALYTINGFNIFKRLKNDTQWHEVSSLKPPLWMPSILTGNNHTLFAGGGTPYTKTAFIGLLKSLNDGLTWVPSNTGMEQQIISSLIFNKNIVTASATTLHQREIPYSGGIFESCDEGSNWEMLANDIPNNDILVLKHMNNNLYAGIEGGGVYLSQDNGHSFKEMNQGMNSMSVQSLLADEKNHLLYAGTWNGILKKSTDESQWAHADHGLKNTTFIADMAKAEDGTLYAGGFYNGIFRSDDRGKSWIPINNGLGEPGDLDITKIVTDGNNIYAGMYFHMGLVKSVDKGLHWQALDLGVSPEKLLVISAIAKYKKALYVSAYSYLGKSLDEGKTWSKVVNGLPISFTVNDILCVDNGTPDGVIYVNADQVIYRSDDGGQHWKIVSSDLNQVGVFKIIFYHSRLYACTVVGEIYMSSNEGKTWVLIGKNNNQERGAFLPTYAAAILGNELYIGTAAGVYKAKLE